MKQQISRRWTQWLPDYFRQPVSWPLALGSIIGAFIGLLIAWQFIVAGDHAGSWTELRLALATVGFFVIQLVVHELGHLLGAVVVRLQLLRVKLGPLQIQFTNGKPRIGLVWSSAQPIGYVAAIPAGGRATRLRMLVFICGGPLARLVAGVTCMVLASQANQSSRSYPTSAHMHAAGTNALFSPQNLETIYFNVAGLIALGCVCTVLIPYQLNGFKTDGAHILQLVTGRRRAEGDLLLASLGRTMGSGTRPRDFDLGIMEHLAGCRDGSPADSPWNLFCYYHALDRGEITQAKEYLSTALSQYLGYPIATRAALFLEGAYVEARHNSNVPAAFGWLADANHEPRVEEQGHCRAEAALLWARGRYVEGARRAELV